MPLWIQSDGTINSATPFVEGDGLLKQLQDFVGGYIEVIHLNDGSSMVINEEGALIGLPNNIKATQLMRGTGTFVLTVNGYLQGPVVVLTPEEEADWVNR